MIARGATNNEIADRLYTSRRTVELHRANMMRKLGLKHLTEVIRYVPCSEASCPPELAHDSGESNPKRGS
ncbi:MAG: helix-turn-helix transcriptional regulator [Chloroflexi bacterium]|nr:helix-turn-helix transcriptional regulator [Chloroflexota bacterium]